MAEPWGAFGEVPFEALVLRSSWELEGCEGLRESQVMGAVLPPMRPVSLAPAPVLVWDLVFIPCSLPADPGISTGNPWGTGVLRVAHSQWDVG